MHREGLVVDDLVQPAERLVVDPQPAFLFHHVPLVRERFLVDPERRHPVGFEPQGQRQILRGHRFPEHRFVIGRVRVALAAPARNHGRVSFGLNVLRALEHQMLEQMREPGAPRFLVFRADVIPELHVDNRRRVILGEDDRQTVRKRRELVLDSVGPDGRRWGEAGQREQADGEQNRGDRTRGYKAHAAIIAEPP
jgi:hypothetical protein